MYIPLKNFPKYSISPVSFEVVSQKSGGPVRLTPVREGGHVYFFLFVNNHRVRKSLWDLIQENWSELSEIISKNINHN